MVVPLSQNDREACGLTKMTCICGSRQKMTLSSKSLMELELRITKMILRAQRESTSKVEGKMRIEE